jgi:hypothetical protein
MRAIVPRTEVKPLTNFIGAILQAEQLGVPIARVLQIQSEQLRMERRQRAEANAAKAPIKMLIPLVGCILPALFVVILGPAIILIRAVSAVLSGSRRTQATEYTLGQLSGPLIAPRRGRNGCDHRRLLRGEKPAGSCEPQCAAVPRRRTASRPISRGAVPARSDACPRTRMRCS